MYCNHFRICFQKLEEKWVLRAVSLWHEASGYRAFTAPAGEGCVLPRYPSILPPCVAVLRLGRVPLPIMVALVTAMYKDTYVKGDTTMSNANGQVVGTRAATHDLPLLVAPVLPDNELFSVETIRVTLPVSPPPGSPADPAEVGSGEQANNEVIPGVVKSFRISSVEKVNSTAVVFHALGGEQVRVWNGVTTVRLSATGPEIPVCSADVTCAAFQVEGAELAEKYLAEAEALLAPFEEGRRRLAEECVLGSVGRDAALTAAKDLCQPLTVESCRALALKNGLTWGGSGKYVYHGCYAFAENGRAYFGTGGSDAEKLQAIVSINSWFPLRLPSLDTDCLSLSNQAKLEAKLEANQAKLEDTCGCIDSTSVVGGSGLISASQLGASQLGASQLTGTLKVGATVTSIGDYAFSLDYTRTSIGDFGVGEDAVDYADFTYTKLTGLDLSEATALTTIGEGAFSENTELTGTLKVGRSVTSIGASAFYDTKLTGLDLSEASALTTIGEGAFSNTALTGTLKVGRSVTSIGDSAFWGTRLTGLDLSEAAALTTIGAYAFENTPLVGQEKCTPNTCFTLN